MDIARTWAAPRLFAMQGNEDFEFAECGIFHPIPPGRHQTPLRLEVEVLAYRLGRKFRTAQTVEHAGDRSAEERRDCDSSETFARTPVVHLPDGEADDVRIGPQRLEDVSQVLVLELFGVRGGVLSASAELAAAAKDAQKILFMSVIPCLF